MNSKLQLIIITNEVENRERERGEGNKVRKVKQDRNEQTVPRRLIFFLNLFVHFIHSTNLS